jgi:hypothetical protein
MRHVVCHPTWTFIADMDEITAFPMISDADLCLKRVLKRTPGKEGLHIMLGKWAPELVEP